MKRVAFAAFSIFLLCMLSLPITLVNSYQEGYVNINFQALTTPVTDGKWTTDEEWNDAATPPNLPATFHWRQKWTWPDSIIQHFLIEFFTDNTNNTGDYFQLCMDRTAVGGAAPHSNCIRIDWVGHNPSGLTIYQGNGTHWEVFTGWTWGTDIYIAESISASPLNSNPHWIIELWLDKSKPFFDISGAGYSPWIRLAVYDESNPEAGVQAWPLGSSQNVPDQWGLEVGTTDNIPEGIGLVTVMLLSSAAVLTGVFCFRKRSKLRNLANSPHEAKS